MKKTFLLFFLTVLFASMQAQTPITLTNGDFSSGDSFLSGSSPWTISGWTISQNTGLSAAGNAAVTAASSGVVSGALKLVGTNSTTASSNNLNQAAAIVESDKIDISSYAGSTTAFTYAFQIKVATATGSAAPWNVVAKVYDASNTEVLLAISQTKSQGSLKTTAAGTYLNASVVGTLLGAASANVKYITIQLHLGQVLANTPTVDNFTLNAAGAAASTTLTQPASTALSYEIGAGPSAEQSFQVAGANLGNNNVTVTPGANIELSTASGSGFASSAITLTQSGGTVNTTTLYARLIAGQNLGSAGANATRQVNVSATGTTTKTIQFTGTVTGISASVSGGSAINYILGAGPSAEKTITVQGGGLTADVVVSPGTNMEISLASGSGSGFVAVAYPSTITLTQLGGVVAATPIYARLKSGLAVGSYADASTKVTALSTGFTSKEIALSGSVTPITPTVTVTPIDTYIYNGSPQGPIAASNDGTGSSYTFSYVGVSPTVYSASATMPTDAGTYTATATVAANGNYGSASSAATAFTIGVATPTVTVTPIDTYTYNGSAQGPIAATNSGTGTSYTFSYLGTGATTYTASASLPTNEGTYTATATVASNGNYSEASSSATAFTIASVVPITSNSDETAISSTTANVTVSGATTTLSITNDKTVNSVTIASGANLNISSTKALTVNGNLDLKADQTSSFSLNLSNGSVSVPTGTFRYLKTMSDTKWYFITFPCAVPISQIQAIGGVAGALTTEWLIKYYDGSRRADSGADGSNWIALTDNTASLEANKGYIFGLVTNNGSVKEIAFPLNKAILSNEASRSTVTISQNSGTATAPNHGWNLSGQPYLSKYDVKGAGVDYIYFAKPDGNGYDYYLKAVDDSKIVDPFTAYFVQYTGSTSVSFGTGSRKAKSLVNTDISDKLQINFTSISGTDRTNIIMDNNFTSDYVVGQDLEKWLGATSSIYTVLGGVNYALNSLPITSASNLPLAYYTQSAGAATISVNAAQAPGLSHLILTDNDNNGVKTTTDLLLTPYNFTAAAGTTTGRFSVSAQKISTAIDPMSFENNTNPVFLSISNGRLVLANVANNSTVRIFDALGRLVANKVATSNSMEIKLNTRGIYTVQLQNGTTISTRKVIF